MNRTALTYFVTVALAVGSAAAMAQDAAAPKTRAQVRAELIEARAQGTLPMGGEFAGTMRHDAPASASTRTAERSPKRAEPDRETKAPIATGG
ncbi:DUF4148 domain-containing protein [Rhizobacter sp. SG703]|uniref:DUF4148 domain-containing protein n=1 Tax=Rhizobacter sp. SG703 TaxID=2587140 RepID=UPI001446D86F|nr:DUF4148 domain-containing protein [Rhizobacter sp. SG703]NKI95995.1 hypothetical protein [Rhizobacter sp. SG703]